MTVSRRWNSLAPILLALTATAARADGPADNLAQNVRRIPQVGIALTDDQTRELGGELDRLKELYEGLAAREKPPAPDLLADILVLYKAVHDAVKYHEFFAPNEVAKARELLGLGIARAERLVNQQADWPDQTGLVVRGYVSKIDGSVQPYGLVVPQTYAPSGTTGLRLDVWFHGRGETLSEVNFLDQRRKVRGEFAPADTIVLHPYGRYCNAFKFAGEVDVLEAIEAVKRNYRIDDDRISARGFSMGGAAAWHFGVHYPDRWFAANPGAGFSETPRFLKVFQREDLAPPWYESKLWSLYDCDRWASNLATCPTVAYSGALDAQKQAADVMEEALSREGIQLVHVIGPGTRHAYHPEARVEVDRRMASLAAIGRQRVPREVHFTTYTLRYNRSQWVTVDRLGEHWAEARVDAALTTDNGIVLKTKNVTAFTLDFPPGTAPFAPGTPVRVEIDGTAVSRSPTFSDRSWSASFVREAGSWKAGSPPTQGLSKRHGVQGPIDDAFMDTFVFVRPTGKSRHPKVQGWVESEMARAIEHWRRHFRGEARVVDDTAVTEALAQSTNLVLWGDPESNSWIGKWNGPIGWDGSGIKVGGKSYDAEGHALIAIYPNPTNPSRYVVLNSGFTFREYDALNNARQVPKLPDWAVIDLGQPPDARTPGKVAAAGFFGEQWELREAEARP